MMGGVNMGKTVMKVEFHLQAPSLMVLCECLNVSVLEFVLLENPILQKAHESHSMFTLCQRFV